MDMETAMDLGREALLMVLIVAGPVLLIGLAVGLVISLFQAVTHLQEQTPTLVPKSIAIAL